MTTAFWNGQFMDVNAAHTNIQDRGYYFGDGVYDGLCTFNGKLFALGEHLDRFFRSLKEVDITCPYSREAVGAILEEGVERADKADKIVYFQVTRGTAPRKHVYEDGMTGNFMMVLFERYNFSKYRNQPAKLLSVPDERWRRCDIKSLNLLPNVLAAKKAQREGCMEALLVRDGSAAECTLHNVFRIKDRVLYTEPLSPLILSGITRGHVIRIARRLGITVREQRSTIEDYYSSDEVFITSSAALILPITHVDSIEIGFHHPMADKLYQEYLHEIAQVCGRVDPDSV